MAAPKIIVVGSVEDGDFEPVFAKITSLHSKNTFALAIIVGDLFGEPMSEVEGALDRLLSGDIVVPVPTYFGLGLHPLPPKVVEHLEASEDGSLCENLFFLGKRTTINTSEGVRIVGLGGRQDTAITAGISKDKYTPFHTITDAKTLKGASTADVLITAEWPKDVRRGSKIPVQESLNDPQGQPYLSELCAALKPRYYFSLSPFFFEREPYFSPPAEDEPNYRPLTRFISLASFRNASKQKWLYAFTLTKDKPTALPAGATASPFTFIPKRPAPEQDFSRFSSETHSRQSSKRARRAPPGPEECFFCLSNSNLAVHLIAAIGEDAYVTTAKGPLTTKETFPSLRFPGHMLIIPLAHTPTLHSIADTEGRQATLEDMTRYRDALSQMLASKSDKVLGSVTWELSKSSGVHTHWQFLPISAALIKKGLVETAFKVEAENLKYPKFVKGTPSTSSGDFFCIWLWSPADNVEISVEPQSLYLPLDPSFRFDAQFGRRVMAKLLKLDERMNWKDCYQSEEEETADVDSFKEIFKPFDFSATED